MPNTFWSAFPCTLIPCFVNSVPKLYNLLVIYQTAKLSLSAVHSSLWWSWSTRCLQKYMMHKNYNQYQTGTLRNRVFPWPNTIYKTKTQIEWFNKHNKLTNTLILGMFILVEISAILPSWTRPNKTVSVYLADIIDSLSSGKVCNVKQGRPWTRIIQGKRSRWWLVLQSLVLQKSRSLGVSSYKFYR